MARKLLAIDRNQLFTCKEILRYVSDANRKIKNFFKLERSTIAYLIVYGRSMPKFASFSSRIRDSRDGFDKPPDRVEKKIEWPSLILPRIDRSSRDERWEVYFRSAGGKLRLEIARLRYRYDINPNDPGYCRSAHWRNNGSFFFDVTV